jgi:hypothetical protein
MFNSFDFPAKRFPSASKKVTPSAAARLAAKPARAAAFVCVGPSGTAAISMALSWHFDARPSSGHKHTCRFSIADASR